MKNEPLKLVDLNSPVVHRRAAEIPAVTSEITALAEEMFKIMKANKGIGLAAPQVGVSLQLAVIAHEPDKDEPKEERIPKTVLINPKIISASKEQVEEEEGCLSVPSIYGPVKRSAEIVVETLNPQGKKIIIKAKGLMARVLQHEIDHLSGMLFIDRVGDPSRLYTYVEGADRKGRPKL